MDEKLIPELYRDGGQPAVQSVGRALKTIFELSNTFLLPLSEWQEKRRLIFQKNMEKFKNSLEAAEQQKKKISEAPPEIGVPIVEKLSYLSHDDLSDLFIRLLRRASVDEESHLAHPRFVEILNAISPDEARLLKCTSGEDYFRCISVRWEKEILDADGFQEKIYYSDPRCLTGVESETLILFPKNIYKYLISLQSLGILIIQEDTTLDEADVPHQEYDDLLNLYKAEAKEGLEARGGFKSSIIYGRIQYTEFGIFFLDACVRDYEDGDGVCAEKSRPQKFGETLLNKIQSLSRGNSTDVDWQSEKSVEDFGGAVGSKSSKKDRQKNLDRKIAIIKNILSGLNEAILILAKNSGVEVSESSLRTIRILFDLKYINRSDYGEIKDFLLEIQNFGMDVAQDIEFFNWSKRSIPIIIEKLKNASGDSLGT